VNFFVKDLSDMERYKCGSAVSVWSLRAWCRVCSGRVGVASDREICSTDASR